MQIKSGIDFWLIASFALLLLVGIFTLASAGTAIGFQTFGDSFYFLKHQLFFGLLPGIVICIALSLINYRVWQKISPFFLFISIGLLILVFIPGLGMTLNNAKSWVDIGPIHFQPAEIVKLLFILYLSGWLARQSDAKIKSFSYGFLPFILLIGIVSALIIAQPDVGTLSIILFASCAIYFTAGANLKHIALLSGFGVALFFILVKLAPYRAERLITFLHPELDPQGIGYHINQAFLAIGSGGFFGLGIGNSRQKFQYLPEATGDSIFAIFAEEMGFFCCFILLALFIFLALRIYRLIQRTDNQFAKLTGTGILSWFLFQTFYNIAAMTGLLPMTGVPLLFISYGGTAMMTAMAAMGILINISRKK
ncbi:putative lipid II flippase FtsW [Candidatus Falkowbacteria bacterium]|nr:putative lipid II flippase FtsW [Candidatus Falkowbacteria bacterium]